VRPEAIIDGVVQGIGILDEKSKALNAKKKGA
jgi:ech hydrogenase subunit C